MKLVYVFYEYLSRFQMMVYDFNANLENFTKCKNHSHFQTVHIQDHIKSNTSNDVEVNER